MQKAFEDGAFALKVGELSQGAAQRSATLASATVACFPCASPLSSTAALRCRLTTPHAAPRSGGHRQRGPHHSAHRLNNVRTRQRTVSCCPAMRAAWPVERSAERVTRCVLRARALRCVPQAGESSRGIGLGQLSACESAGRGPRPRRRGSRARATRASVCAEQDSRRCNKCVPLLCTSTRRRRKSAHAFAPKRLQRGARGCGTARITARSSQLPAHVARCGGVYPPHGAQQEAGRSRSVAAQRRVQHIARVRAGGGGRRAAASLARHAGGGLCASGGVSREPTH